MRWLASTRSFARSARTLPARAASMLARSAAISCALTLRAAACCARLFASSSRFSLMASAALFWIAAERACAVCCTPASSASSLRADSRRAWALSLPPTRRLARMRSLASCTRFCTRSAVSGATASVPRPVAAWAFGAGPWRASSRSSCSWKNSSRGWPGRAERAASTALARRARSCSISARSAWTSSSSATLSMPRCATRLPGSRTSTLR